MRMAMALRLLGCVAVLSACGCEQIASCLVWCEASRQAQADITRHTHDFAIAGSVVDEQGQPIEHCQMQMVVRSLGPSIGLLQILPSVAEDDRVEMLEVDGTFSVRARGATVVLRFGRAGYRDSTVQFVAKGADAARPAARPEPPRRWSSVDATYVGTMRADVRVVLHRHRPGPLTTISGELEYRADGSSLAAAFEQGERTGCTFDQEIAPADQSRLSHRPPGQVYLDRRPPPDGILYIWTEVPASTQPATSPVVAVPKFLHFPGEVAVVTEVGVDALAAMHQAPMMRPRLPPLGRGANGPHPPVPEAIFLNGAGLRAAPGGDRRVLFYFLLGSRHGKGSLTLRPPRDGVARASVVLQVQEDGSRCLDDGAAEDGNR